MWRGRRSNCSSMFTQVKDLATDPLEGEPKKRKRVLKTPAFLNFVTMDCPDRSCNSRSWKHQSKKRHQWDENRK